MMTVQAVDATPYRKIYWDAIDWKRVEQAVRRLQARIVKALKKKSLRRNIPCAVQ